MKSGIFIKIAGAIKGKKHFCPVCGKKVSAFNTLPLSYLTQLARNECIHNIFRFETLNSMHYSCPKCGASDRNRLIALYLLESKALAINKILDFAPSKQLSKFIKKFRPAEYRTVDLYMKNVDDHADIQNLFDYTNENYDLVICSHVLEHIENDRKAIGEIYRVLKHGGTAIFLSPVHLDLKEDYENALISGEDDRWKHFAQNDHLRIYSRTGFISKIEEAGFKVLQYRMDHFGEEAFFINGIHSNSVLYIAIK